jgi:hypothetical protein
MIVTLVSSPSKDNNFSSTAIEELNLSILASALTMACSLWLVEGWLTFEEVPSWIRERNNFKSS